MTLHEFVTEYTPVAMRIAKARWNNGYRSCTSHEDVVAEACLALCEMYGDLQEGRSEQERGRWVYLRLQGAITSYLRLMARQHGWQRSTSSYPARLVYTDDLQGQEHSDKVAQACEAQDLVESTPLTDKERYVLTQHYDYGRTLTEIAGDYGQTLARISQIHRAALIKIRKYADEYEIKNGNMEAAIWTR